MNNAKNLVPKLGALLLATVLPLSASAITVTSASPNWVNYSGSGTSEGWNGNYYDVRWGTSTGYGKSGLGFNPTNTSFNANIDQVFELGVLKHYNNPVTGTIPASVDLSLSLNFLGVSGNPDAVFNYRFLIDETPNEGRVRDCEYPSTTACADKISFVNLNVVDTFTLAGVDYTLELLGFGDSASSITTSFISQEKKTNSTKLWAKFTAVPVEVPEPASLGLLGLGLLGVGIARRKAAKA